MMRKKWMARVLCVVLAATVGLGILPTAGLSFTVALAQEAATSGSCGESLTWTLDTDGLLTISGTGAMEDYEYGVADDSSSSPFYPLRDSIKRVVIEDGATTIGALAFFGCEQLESIAIPESVESIYDWAAMGCKSLTSIEISSKVSLIASGAFAECSSLASIVVDPENTVYDSRDGCNAIIETETNTLLTGCSATTIPSGITTIDGDAFSGCVGLSSIEIPAGVTYIGLFAFSDCTSLSRVVLSEGLEEIGAWAFYDCPSLTSIEIPDSVTHVGRWSLGYWDDKNASEDRKVDGFTIIANRGTEAECYATEAGIAFQEIVDLETSAVVQVNNASYTGKAITPFPKVVVGETTLVRGTDYDVSYKDNKNVGTATMTITGKGKYKGTVTKTFKIIKATNPLGVKPTTKTLKYAKVLKAKVSFSITASKAQGKVSYAPSSRAKNAGIKVSTKGKVTVPKGCKKGRYAITVRAVGGKNYKAAAKKVIITVK